MLYSTRKIFSQCDKTYHLSKAIKKIDSHYKNNDTNLR